MAHKRTRSVVCSKCGGLGHIKVNLDNGTVEESVLPEKCSNQSRCARAFVDGVFDRPFGERIIRPNGVKEFGG